MNSKDLKNKVQHNEYLETLHGVGFCEVSKASVLLMLERVCNGKEVDFPFSR
tara:strand:- start:531 stop:686 length:156 start_codon:yes stop_codon:yes gene_type:complete